MSYETQGQNPSGATPPANDPYAYPPAGQPGTAYATPPVQQSGSNGFAIAALIFGILPTVILGLIFGFLGLSRAKKVGGTGKTMAIIGIVLSILWIGAYAAAVPALSKTAKTVSQRLDPGCVSAESLANNATTKMNADQGNIDALKTDFQSVVTGLNSAAAKSDNATSKAAISKLSGDFQELLGNLNSGTQPSDDLVTRLQTDGTAMDTACGRT